MFRVDDPFDLIVLKDSNWLVFFMPFISKFGYYDLLLSESTA